MQSFYLKSFEIKTIQQKYLFTSGSVQDCGYDGARLCNDRRDRALLMRLCECTALVGENCGHLSTLFRATFDATSLRLWHEGCQVCADGSWKPQGMSAQFNFHVMEYFHHKIILVSAIHNPSVTISMFVFCLMPQTFTVRVLRWCFFLLQGNTLKKLKTL